MTPAADYYCIPMDDEWILKSLSSIVIELLCTELSNDFRLRKALVRFLSALQNLPEKPTGLSTNITIGPFQLTMNGECFGLSAFDCTPGDAREEFRLVYFDGDHQCFRGSSLVFDSERNQEIGFVLEDLFGAVNNGYTLHVEEYYRGQELNLTFE